MRVSYFWLRSSVGLAGRVGVVGRSSKLQDPWAKGASLEFPSGVVR